MANIKFSDFTAFGSNPIDASSGLVAYKGTDNIQFTPAELAPLTGLYAADGTLAGARTITMDGNTLSMAQASGNTVTFSSLNNEGISIAGGFNYKIATGSGTFTIDSSTTANSNAISLQTISGGGGNASILINSRSTGANADLHLKTATKLKIDLPVAATVGYVLKADDTAGNVSWGAETDTNTNIANANLTADAARTLTMGTHNLTIASTTTGQEVKFGQNVRVDGQGYTLQNDQSGITIDWDTGNVQYIALASGSQTFTPSNAESGATYILQLRQPGSGAAGTINWNNLVNWPGGTDPTLTATNGAFDVVTLMYNGTLSKYFGTVVLDLK